MNQSDSNQMGDDPLPDVAMTLNILFFFSELYKIEITSE